jgi:hypothetical protein
MRERSLTLVGPDDTQRIDHAPITRHLKGVLPAAVTPCPDPVSRSAAQSITHAGFELLQ